MLVFHAVLAAWACAASPFAPPPPRPAPPRSAPRDARELARLQEFFERALNDDDFSALEPYLDPAFEAQLLTGDRVAGVEGLRGYLAKMRQRLGPGARYRIRLNPDAPRLSGDSAAVSGATVEEIVFPDGTSYTYRSQWKADCAYKDGRWVLAKMSSEANLLDKLTVAARAVLSRMWAEGINLRRPRLGRPDWDGDTTDGTLKPAAD